MGDITFLLKAIPTAFAALLPVINPIGTAVILLGLTSQADSATHRRIARGVAINAVILLLVVLVAGRLFLALFGISVPIVQLAGGAVIAGMGWSMLFQPDASAEAKAQDSPSGDHGDYSGSIFYPFTFPLTIGPGSIAVALTLSAHTSRGHLLETAMAQFGAAVGVVAAAFVTYLCLANADRLARRLGPSGLSVLMRLSAFIVVCLGVEIAWSGLKTLAPSLGAAG
ncbi:MAG: NAAT family transporter [Steroidobacteraceae bacterium]|nr:NAAT family transporter [Steroidobacteraceae bacterium]